MARSPHTDPIADLFEEYAAWFEKQAGAPHLDAANRTKCIRELAGAYRMIAQIHVLLACDLVEYGKWMARFREVLPAEFARPSEDNGGMIASP